MNRRDWLLLLLAFEGAPEGLDPVRIQKAMFLFAHTAGRPARERYDFVPHDYGPMSKGVYADLDVLVSAGDVAAEPVQGSTYARYRPTDAGIDEGRRVADVAAVEAPEAANVLFDIKQRVANLTFEDLLNEIYDEYPDFAVRSVFRSRR